MPREDTQVSRPIRSVPDVRDERLRFLVVPRSIEHKADEQILRGLHTAFGPSGSVCPSEKTETQALGVLRKSTSTEHSPLLTSTSIVTA